MECVEPAVTSTFDPDALREKYRDERDKRLRADGNEQYRRGRRRRSPTTSTTRTSSRSSASPSFDEVDVVVVGGGFGGLLAGARLREAGIDDVRDHREGRRLRRHLVLEPLPGRDVRRRVVHLPAAARGARLRPEGEVRPRAARSSRTAGRSASTSTCTAAPASRPRSPSCAGTTSTRAGSSRPTAATSCGRASCAWRTGRCTGRSCRASPGSRRSPGHSFHTSRWDYAYTGGDSDGGLDRPARQARRHHRHGRDRGAVRAAPRRGRRAPLRVPAHAVVDRRARQPADRSGVGGDPRARLAAAADGQLQHPRLRRLRGRGPRRRRLDRHHRQAAAAAAQRRPGRTSARAAWPRPSSWPTSRRWNRSGRASTPSSTTRRRPRR